MTTQTGNTCTSESALDIVGISNGKSELFDYGEVEESVHRRLK